MLLLLLHLGPLTFLLLTLCASKTEPVRTKKTLRRDIAAVESDAPSVQRSVQNMPRSEDTVEQSISRCVSMSGQRPKSRQKAMSDSARSEYKNNGSNSKMDSVQMSSQLSSKPTDSAQLSVQGGSDEQQAADYFQKPKNEEMEQSNVPV